MEANPLGLPKDADREEITYASADSSLGIVLVARSAVGICAILFAMDDDELERDLANRFPNNRLISDQAGMRDDMAKVIACIDWPHRDLDLPLDMRHGTAFQRKVWEVIRTVPCSATISYAAIARRLGMPHAARAVAGACAANAIAMGIPCHRVVHDKGTLSGYRWGAFRKRVLLNREQLF
jgi:methylated-DNA-[protein]-cysteine S-methyltransferase/AraC family transcriptional regulator of adaptative response/methylated-DNA-[protein]-cysteine methyltransferase